jgi:hypothetical protein
MESFLFLVSKCDVFDALLYCNEKIKLCLCYFLIEHRAMKEYWGSGCTAPRILDLGTIWEVPVYGCHLYEFSLSEQQVSEVTQLAMGQIPCIFK